LDTFIVLCFAIGGLANGRLTLLSFSYLFAFFEKTVCFLRVFCDLYDSLLDFLVKNEGDSSEYVYVGASLVFKWYEPSGLVICSSESYALKDKLDFD